MKIIFNTICSNMIVKLLGIMQPTIESLKDIMVINKIL